MEKKLLVQIDFLLSFPYKQLCLVAVQYPLTREVRMNETAWFRWICVTQNDIEYMKEFACDLLN